MGFEWNRKKKNFGKIVLVMTLSNTMLACSDEEDDSKVALESPGVRTVMSVNMGNVLATQAAMDRGIDITGRAIIVRKENAMTTASVQVLGLTAGASYGVHVHDLPCALGGGGHYKNDPAELSVSGTDNELWLSFIADANSGIGLAEVSKSFVARPEAQSIVVHDTDGTRIGCADLNSNLAGATVHSGSMEKFSDQMGFGWAQLSRSNGISYAKLRVEGLNADVSYASHVHNLPCSEQNGGGHYKIDPSNTVTEEVNEMWLTLTTDGNGDGASEIIVSAHTARPEAQSVVVHDTDGSRLGCADLLPHVSEADATSKGNPITTETGFTNGHDLRGSATMVRTSDGRTTVDINVTGLAAAGTYNTHVHDLPCKLGGGGHYKIDPAGSGEANEIWPVITANAQGVGFGSADVTHIARAEAQALVIHDSSGRIACFDLD